jgi:hypothetical protein
MTFEELDMDMQEVTVSDAELDLFEQLDRRLPKAGHTGTIVNIEVYYNVSPYEMHPSLRSFVQSINKIQDLKHLKSKDTSNSSDFLPSMKLPNTAKFKGVSFKSPIVAIVYYIQDTHDANIGDKVIFASQLKSIVSEVVSTPIVTESGRVIDAQFSPAGVMNRIITTPFIQGCTQMLLEKLEEDIVDLYFK